MTTDENPWDPAPRWLEVAVQHPMMSIPFGHTLLAHAAGHVSVTLHLWQWVNCEHEDERLWILRPVEEPGTTASGVLADALVRAYSLLESRWGLDSPGEAYAAAVGEALELASHGSTSPPQHPYSVPQCGPCIP